MPWLMDLVTLGLTGGGAPPGGGWPARGSCAEEPPVWPSCDGTPDAAIAKCIIAEVRTKYGTNEGVRCSVYSCEYDFARPWMASAAEEQTSLGKTLDVLSRSLIKGRKMSNMAKW